MKYGNGYPIDDAILPDIAAVHGSLTGFLHALRVLKQHVTGHRQLPPKVCSLLAPHISNTGN
jgi:hypothetical protein